MNKYDRINLSIQFPLVFEQLKGTDADFEMVTSNTIQPIKLLYQYNVVKKKFAAIFVNTKVWQLQWSQAVEKGAEAKKLFRETFEFQENEVAVHTDLTKPQIIEKFDWLQKMVNDHEAINESKARHERETIFISIVWIGHTLYLGNLGLHKALVELRNSPNVCTDGTTALKQFGLTTFGKPINVYEYTTRLAKGPETHLLKILDYCPKHLGELKANHIDSKEDFWEMTLTNHSGESRCSFVSQDVLAFC